MELIEHIHFSGHVWMAAYVEGRNEHFEIRTESLYDLDHQLLWHSMAPIGSVAADFIYLDLNDLQDALAGTDSALAKDDMSEVSRTVQTLLQKSVCYLPFSVELMRAAKIPARKRPFRALRELAERYKNWQRTFEHLDGGVFSARADIDRPSRYMEQRIRAPHSFCPALKYGEVSLESVRLNDGVQRSFPARPYFIAEVLNTEDADQFFCYMISKYLQAQLRMRLCKYCGRYFVLHGNSNQEYCDRPMDGSRCTCKEAGAMKLYVQRQNTDPAVRAYKRAYKTNYARIAYGLMTKEDFDAWSRQARKMRDKCVAGEISQEDFDDWLESGRPSNE